MTFPTHPAAVVGLALWRPRWFDGVALASGAVAPDIAYVLDGSGLPVWPFSHQLAGLIGWSLPVALVVAWTVRRTAPVFAAHLPAAGPLALRDYAAIRFNHHPWWVTAFSGLLGAASHLVLDRLETEFSWMEGTLEVAGGAALLALMVYIGRRRWFGSRPGDLPTVRGRPVLFWSVAGALAAPAAAVIPWLPAAQLAHTTGARLLCAVAAALVGASVAVSLRNRRSGDPAQVRPPDG